MGLGYELFGCVGGCGCDASELAVVLSKGTNEKNCGDRERRLIQNEETRVDLKKYVLFGDKIINETSHCLTGIPC